ncbi:MAG: DUF167 domain-containing protein [Nitrospirota bacterium]
MLRLLVMVIPFSKSAKGIILKVRLEPRSSRKGVSGLIGDSLKIKVHSPPVGGAANDELMEILSERFGVKKSAIKIIKGRSSRDKVLEIEGLDSVS